MFIHGTIGSRSLLLQQQQRHRQQLQGLAGGCCLPLSALIYPTYLPFCLPANRRALEEGYVCVCVCNVCLDDAWRSLPPGAAAALSARRHAFDRYHGEYSVCTLSVQCRAIGTGHYFESIPPLWTQQLQQLSDTLETRIFVYLSLLSGR